MDKRTHAMCRLAVLSAICSSGCVGTYKAYDGPTRPIEEVAVLMALPPGITIHEIRGPDGKVIRPPAQASRVSMLPGEYEVTVSYRKVELFQTSFGAYMGMPPQATTTGVFPSTTIPLSVEAGRWYAIDPCDSAANKEWSPRVTSYAGMPVYTGVVEK